MTDGTVVEISHVKIPEKLEIQEEIQKFLNKFQTRWNISKFKLDVDTHSPGGRLKYSMHARVIASETMFNIKASGWDIPSTLDILFKKMGKTIGKELKKERTRKISISRKISKPFLSLFLI